MFGGDVEWRVGVNFGHNGDDEFSYYGYRIKGHSGFSMIDMDFIYGYPFYEGTRQRMTADVGVGWWSGNVPEDHPYSRKDPQALKDQIMMPVCSFFRRLRQLVTGRKAFRRSFTNKGEKSKV